MNSSGPDWRFRQMHPGEMNIDPIEAEFFSTEALDSLADALVREAVQNSLDARRPGVPLRMRFAFPHPTAMLNGEVRDRYLSGLMPHLNASRSGLTAPPGADEPLSYLVIEDFGTRGLQGDPAQSEDEGIEADADRRNDFFYFWRNIGRSRKHAAELGRWGLGKTVFQAASRVNAFFGVTVRADDRRRMLLGQSVLKIHKLDSARYYPYGYFGSFDGDFALPVEKPAWLQRCANDFGLARGDDPGLSVIVPYPDSELDPEAITASVVRHYFLPIIAGDLVVEVRNGNESAMLDAGSLSRFVAGRRGVDSPRLFALAKWGLETGGDQHVRLSPPARTSAPRWVANPIEPEVLAGLRQSFDAGEPVAVTVPVWVKPTGETPELSSFNLYLERDENGGKAEQHYVRDGITIAGVRAAMPKGIRSLLVVRDAPLSRLLGDSENPAHTEWQERSPKFRDRYRHGPFTLRYVKNAPRELVRLLTQPAEGRDYRLLKQLFSLELPDEESVRNRSRPGSPGPGGGTAGDSTDAAIVGNDRLFRLQKLQGGFRLSAASDDVDLPRFTALSVAYDVRRGNPFKHWQAPDFCLDKAPVAISVTGARVVRCQENLLVLQLNGHDFRVTVRGFDRLRDVRVRVSPFNEDYVP